MADYIQLTKTGEIFTFDGDGVPSPAGQSITVSCAVSTGTPTWSATRYNQAGVSLGPCSLSGSTASARSVDVTAFGDAAYVIVTATVVIASTTYTGFEYLTRYQIGTASNLGKQPDANSDYWTDVGPTNRFAMFDLETSSQTILTSPLTVVIDPGAITSLTLLNVDATSASVTVTNGPSGATIFSGTQTFSGHQDAVTFSGIPSNAASRATITVSGTGTVKCGGLLAGTGQDLGKMLAAPEISIVDFSKVTTDDFGTKTFVQRAYSKKIAGQIMVPNTSVQAVWAALAALRATPCLWTFSDDPRFSSLLSAYGAYRSVTMAITYPSYSVLSIEVESLT